MGEHRQRLAWRRYRRGLRTIPVIVVGSVVLWAISGAGAFWPGWVLLWGAVARGLRAQRALRLGEPDDVPELAP
jgi:hypothetical protein